MVADTKDTEIYDEDYPTEFADDESSASSDSYLGDDVTDAEWSDDVADDDMMDGDDSLENPPPKKKRSVFSTILIVLVAVVGVLGFLVIKGGGNAPAPQGTPQDMAAGNPAAQTPADSLAALKDAPVAEDSSAMPTAQPPVNPADTAGAPATAPAPQQGGLMDNPAVLDQQPSETPSEPVVAPQAAQETPAQEAPAALGAPTMTAPVAALDNPVVPAVKPVSDFPTVDTIKKPEVEPAAPAAVPATPAPVVTAETLAPTPAPASASAPVADDSATKLADLEKQLADKDAELQSQKDKAQTASTEMQTLKARVAELEKNLAAATAKVAEKPQPEEKPVAVIPAHDEEAVVVDAPPVKPKKVVAAAPAAAPVAAPRWVLKSAKPGHAVLSNSKTGDYKTVAVGDMVSGLGKITAIQETPKGWVVRGTQGQVAE